MTSLAAPLRRSAGMAVKWAAAALDRVATPAGGIVVLIYHRVGARGGGQMNLSVDVFDAQLAWLREHRTVLSLDDAVRALADGTTSDGVVVTFDDGTRDWVDHVLPRLERHRVPATFYVATDFVDRQVPFPDGGDPIDWAGLADLAAHPLATIGSHTHTHALLDRLSRREVDAELDRSIDLLGTHLGTAPAHFAYPKAVAGNPDADAAVRARFRTAVLAGTRANRAGADLHRLHRTPVQASDGQAWFRRKALGGMHLEDDLRALANRVRYRGLDR